MFVCKLYPACLFDCLCSKLTLFFLEPLAFLKPPPIILRGYVGQKVEIDCSTNDEDATVSLLHKNHPLVVFNKRQLKENKLSKRGQVFTLLNVDLSDAGIYACEANSQASRMIRWPSGTGYLILFRGKVIFKLNIRLQ